MINYTKEDWKGFPLDECYCVYAPVVAGIRIWRCNICVNQIIEAKNELARREVSLKKIGGEICQDS